MPRQRDIRNYASVRDANVRRRTAAARRESASAEDKVSPTNAVTGTPRTVTPVASTTTNNDYVASALEHVGRVCADMLGFTSGETPEFVPDPHVQRTSSGTTIVHLHQQYHGIPVFEMTRSVQFGRDQTVERIVGDNVSIVGPLPTAAVLPPADALRIAARYLAEHHEEPEPDAWGQSSQSPAFHPPSDYQPRVITAFDRPNRPTVLDRGPFGKETEASLVFFYTGSDMRLCWKLLVTMPDLTDRYLMLVAADRATASLDDAVLLCQYATSRVAARVFLHNPGAGQRELIDLPLLPDKYPLNGTRTMLPNPFPQAWWLDHDRTTGNCASVVQAADSAPLAATVDGSEVRFDPSDAAGSAQQLLNAFFFCNYMHDFFYLLGFDEAAGNFQKVNFTNGGSANDAVLCRVHAIPIPKTATFDTPGDGVPPALNLGVVEHSDGTSRHTALDADVVFHEYVHGVTNRLVGGRLDGLALQHPQSRGLGEGWSDYFALTVQGHGHPQEKLVIGAWVSGRSGGIRSAPYDEHYPNTFGRLGTAPFTSDHHIGEIWCAALMQMHRELDKALGAPRGGQLGWQVIVDALKLTPANPSFVDARDAILKAIDDFHRDGTLSAVQWQASRRAGWTAFARFGIGAGARSDGASLQGIVEDLTLPSDV